METQEQKSNLAQLRDVRLEKIQSLRKMGIDPYPAIAKKDVDIKKVLESFSEFENKTIKLAGRLMSLREHGQLVFGHIADQSAKIQLYIRNDTINSYNKERQNLGFSELNLLDVGDFVNVEGTITKTKTGEISVLVKDLWLISKALRPLPDKWKSITDKETRYRRRYLDLTMNQETKELFVRKAKFFEAARDFLTSRGFMEVETPVLEYKTGGADARPFITHHNDLGIDLYMRISTELYQKRLIGGGYEKIFTLGPNFRNEGVDDEHLQEYQQIEWYWAYADYKDNMQLTKDLFIYLAQQVYGRTVFETRGHKFDLAKDWKEIDYAKIIKSRLGINIFKDSELKMLRVIEKAGIHLKGRLNRNRLIDNLWKIIRKTIPGPAFLINEPKFMSPLAKSLPDNPELTQRFHIIIAGSELGNGYSEINDPVDQLDRFLEQEEARLEGDDESQMLDIDFVEMLEYGMPPTSGFGMSERVFWYLEDISGREGTFFPLMRQELENSTKQIYGDILRPDKIKVRHQDKSRKMVLVLNKELKGWELTNTIGHLSAYLGSRVGENITSRPTFTTQDGKELPANSQYPIITLAAKSSQLIDLMDKLNKESLQFLIYVDEMIKFSDDVQLAKMISQKELDKLNILGIGIFGENDKINILTKKFSLWK